MSYDLSIAQLRGTAAQLKATNDTVAAGRLCKETDTGKWKSGTGLAYNSEAYILLDGEEGKNADVAYDVMRLGDGRDDTGGGSSAWGGITGTLSDQTDLQGAQDAQDAAIAGKEDVGVAAGLIATEVTNRNAAIALGLAPTFVFSYNTDTAGSEPLGGAIRFNNATIGSVTQIALGGVVNGVNKGDLFTGVTGILRGHVLGTTDTFEFLITGVPTFGLWTLVPVTYLKGTIPTNLAECAIDFLPANTINAATTSALALKADIASIPKRYKFTGDGGAATGTIGVNTYPMAVTVTNPVAGAYRFTAASGTPFTVGKTYVSVAVVETTNPLTWRLTQLDSTTVRVEIFDTTSGTATDPASGYLITIETEP